MQRRRGRRSGAARPEQQAEAIQRLAAGESVSQLARDYKTSRTTIQRLREKEAA
ncbi:helix-turn-helix domain-containing protein [Paraburkholderia fungorum]|uniref:helix-turn-helix domain-containing protein n=1 Tax=Paraburkholderia fungorum TaxID=134537 RepID=UPI0038BAF43B